MARKNTNQMSLFGATEGELAMTAVGFEFVGRGAGYSTWARGDVHVRIAEHGITAFRGTIQGDVPASLDVDSIRACLTMFDEVYAALAS